MPATGSPSPQPCLPGLELPQPTDGLFFAVLPDPPALAQIRALKARLSAELGIGTGWRPARVLHVSLQPVGTYLGLPKDVVAAARLAGAAVRAPPCDVTFDRLVHFGSRKGRGRNAPGGPDPGPIVLGCHDGAPALQALWATLGEAMQAAWLRPQRRSAFTPHLTLLYSGAAVPEGPLDDPITLTVGSFVLVHSLYGETRYKPVGRWPLRL